MIDRKKKLRLIQIGLLVIGTLIILFTYFNQNETSNEKIVSKEKQEKIKKQLENNNTENSDVFYNIEYSGLDLAGNRYILKSKEARNSKSESDVVNMKFVEAKFYFKDGTVLSVSSDIGVYNNVSLDMVFKGDVNATYEGSQLFAQKAEYSNSKNFLIISEKVKIKDIRGTMVADKLLFDIKKQTLNIASFNDDKINANINLK
tara:strand:- start:3098 stop:3706 length:609 start_codon:yes stop_codon:yes gene_type:complete